MIFVECNPDAFLLRRLGLPRKSIRHEGGKGKVFEKVGKSSGMVGMVDEDPQSGQPRELGDYEVRESFGSLILRVNRTDHSKRIIQVSPYLEEWLVERARKNGISLKDYNLPDDAVMLHDIPYVQDNPRFSDFLGALIETDIQMKRLILWIMDGKGQ